MTRQPDYYTARSVELRPTTFNNVTQVPADLPRGYITPDRAELELQNLRLAPGPPSHPTSALVISSNKAIVLRDYIGRDGYRRIVYGINLGVLANQRPDQDFTGVAPVSCILYVSERVDHIHEPLVVPILYPHPGPSPPTDQRPHHLRPPTPRFALMSN